MNGNKSYKVLAAALFVFVGQLCSAQSGAPISAKTKQFHVKESNPEMKQVHMNPLSKDEVAARKLEQRNQNDERAVLYSPAIHQKVDLIPSEGIGNTSKRAVMKRQEGVKPEYEQSNAKKEAIPNGAMKPLNNDNSAEEDVLPEKKKVKPLMKQAVPLKKLENEFNYNEVEPVKQP